MKILLALLFIMTGTYFGVAYWLEQKESLHQEMSAVLQEKETTKSFDKMNVKFKELELPSNYFIPMATSAPEVNEVMVMLAPFLRGGVHHKNNYTAISKKINELPKDLYAAMISEVLTDTNLANDMRYELLLSAAMTDQDVTMIANWAEDNLATNEFSTSLLPRASEEGEKFGEYISDSKGELLKIAMSYKTLAAINHEDPEGFLERTTMLLEAFPNEIVAAQIRQSYLEYFPDHLMAFEQATASFNTTLSRKPASDSEESDGASNY